MRNRPTLYYALLKTKSMTRAEENDITCSLALIRIPPIARTPRRSYRCWSASTRQRCSRPGLSALSWRPCHLHEAPFCLCAFRSHYGEKAQSRPREVGEVSPTLRAGQGRGAFALNGAGHVQFWCSTAQCPAFAVPRAAVAQCRRRPESLRAVTPCERPAEPRRAPPRSHAAPQPRSDCLLWHHLHGQSQIQIHLRQRCPGRRQ